MLAERFVNVADDHAGSGFFDVLDVPIPATVDQPPELHPAAALPPVVVTGLLLLERPPLTASPAAYVDAAFEFDAAQKGDAASKPEGGSAGSLDGKTSASDKPGWQELRLALRLVLGEQNE